MAGMTCPCVRNPTVMYNVCISLNAHDEPQTQTQSPAVVTNPPTKHKTVIRVGEEEEEEEENEEMGNTDKEINGRNEGDEVTWNGRQEEERWNYIDGMGWYGGGGGEEEWNKRKGVEMEGVYSEKDEQLWNGINGTEEEAIKERRKGTHLAPTHLTTTTTTTSTRSRRYSTLISIYADEEIIEEKEEEEDDEEDPSLFRKVSNTSDYSLSSEASFSSSSSCPPPPPPPPHFHRISITQDSDYFGSEEEEEEEEEEGGEEEEEERDWLPPLHKISKEYDLEQRIALEIKMREGTTKLLAACGGGQATAGRGGAGTATNLPHTLEAAKNLLTSNERMTAYMAELQRRRTASASAGGLGAGCQPSLARVCLSDLRMPLIWKDSDHFKNRGDYRRFAVFVLLKIGTEIYDTVMVNPVDRSMTDICFDDIIVFNNIPHNFECRLEVYSHILQHDLSMASTPRKLKRSLHSSISRTVGRKLAATLRDELASGDMGPKFDLVATSTLTLESVSNNTATYDLTMENVENQASQLPLFGHFCCRLAAQPDCATQERIAGMASVKEEQQQAQWWCRVQGWQLEVWPSKEEAQLSLHHPRSLSIDRHTEVTQEGPQITVTNPSGYARGSLTLTLESTDEALSWVGCLRQHTADHRLWGTAAEGDMEILTPQPARHSFLLPPRRSRFASLYEETPLRDGSPVSDKSSLDDIYTSGFVSSYCTPATSALPPRTRTLSSLSSRGSFRRWGSVRCNMPFFKSKS